MSALLRIEVVGVDELVLGLSRAITGFEDRAELMFRSAGDRLTVLTGQLAPYDEGFLARSVRHRRFEDGIGFEVGWFWPDFAAAGKAPYYWWVEYGTLESEPQPSLGPAWAHVGPSLFRNLEALFVETMR